MLSEVKNNLNSLGNKEKAKILAGFFKTGKGQYGEGDIFLGITVPEQRKVAGKFYNLPFNVLRNLLETNIHEYRLTALFVLMNKYDRADELKKKEIFEFYLKNIKGVNNWDLVDLSSPRIIGDFLYKKDKNILYKLAKSRNLWERRISILSTYYFIRKNNFEDTLAISELLLNDKEDLIQKAVGWMLREIGKRDIKAEEDFLRKNYRKMPRTMLRYAIERFSSDKKRFYMEKNQKAYKYIL